MIHEFKHAVDFQYESFTDPFRYSPHPLVQKAATLVMQRIDRDPILSADDAGRQKVSYQGSVQADR